MKIKVTKQQMAEVGKASLKVGKAIIIEGTKAVISKGAMNVVVTGLDEGSDGIKKMQLDDVLGKKKTFMELLKSKTKKRKKLKVTEEDIKEVLTEIAEDAYEAGLADGGKKLKIIPKQIPEA